MKPSEAQGSIEVFHKISTNDGKRDISTNYFICQVMIKKGVTLFSTADSQFRW